MSDSDWQIYGATGYTGELIARHAAALGHHPVLAGRRREPIEALARELGCPARVYALDDPQALAQQLSGCRVVLNCAGPFSRTARPLMDACLAGGVHYLDITGEIGVIEAGAERHEAALRAGVTLLPAVGFDVVPTDCLASLLAEQLPGAEALELAFSFTGGMSRGTTRTMLEGLPEGGRARIAGRIERVPTAWKIQKIPFRDRARWAMTIPWGDVASAFYTTGIPNIEVYLATPRVQIRWARRIGWAFRLLKWGPIARLARWQVDHLPAGPDAATRERERTQLWGRVRTADGRSASATLVTLSGYHLTILTAVEAALRVRAGGVPTGFSTPARAFGSRFVLEFPDTDLEWQDSAAATKARDS